MSQFIDSSDYKIENGVPKYYCTSLSYRDKLKNGLSFDHVFELENYCASFEAKVSVRPEVCQGSKVTESSDYDYEEQDINFPRERKGKWILFKKPIVANFKKNKIKQLGYDDKQFNLEQNTIFDFVSDSDNDSDYYDDDSSYQGHTYRIIRQVKESERLFL